MVRLEDISRQLYSPPNACFNSYMVRLEAAGPEGYNELHEFQFLYGAIGRFAGDLG